jgi:hypothetical protein
MSIALNVFETRMLGNFEPKGGESNKTLQRIAH